MCTTFEYSAIGSRQVEGEREHRVKTKADYKHGEPAPSERKEGDAVSASSDAKRHKRRVAQRL
tara:strand:- start:229 stop:417 length:189 start_codon:yes stop_codon:yes gene_type:complete